MEPRIAGGSVSTNATDTQESPHLGGVGLSLLESHLNFSRTYFIHLRSLLVTNSVLIFSVVEC